MTGHPKRILVVDDDPTILKALEQALEQEGYEVARATDGLEALRRAREFRPDLVILDIMLPKMDGFAVCSQLQMMGPIPCLILSARGEEADKVTGFTLGADDYLTKPFRLSELVLRVRAILRRTANPRPVPAVEVLRLRDVEINRSTRTVKVRDRQVDLSPKEFELLWLLASRPGHVFSREVLLRRIWHSDHPGDVAALTVCVRRLREKIEEDPGHPVYIKTVWGIGYKFDG